MFVFLAVEDSSIGDLVTQCMTKKKTKTKTKACTHTNPRTVTYR